MKLIVLDAGDSFELDGFNKLLLKNPSTHKTIIEEYIEKYKLKEIDIVVGYNAISIMNAYPHLNYIYNNKWQVTNNSYSLSLALNENPCIVTSCDFFISSSLVHKINQFDNCIVIKRSENKRLESINVSLDNSQHVNKIYRGKSKGNDHEMMGIFKVTDTAILKQWKKNCLNSSHLFIGENLPITERINVVTAEKDEIYEINSTLDYINYINYWKIQ
jgi:choline kinase